MRLAQSYPYKEFDLFERDGICTSEVVSQPAWGCYDNMRFPSQRQTLLHHVCTRERMRGEGMGSSFTLRPSCLQSLIRSLL